MRLYDILRSVDPSFPSMHAFIADEIAVKIDGEEAADFTSWPAEAYGKVAPPFPEFFVETRVRVSLKDAGYGDNDEKVTIERGVIVNDVTALPQVQENAHLPKDVSRPAGTHWVLAFFGFTRYADEDLCLFPGHGYIHLGSDGRVLDDMSLGIHLVEYPRHALIPGATYLPNVQMLATYIPFVLFAIKAIHERQPVEHVVPGRQARRLAERKYGVNLHDHYVLRITTPSPQRRYPKTVRPSDEPKKTKRQHAVRGHFRMYTEEKPLFGRITGTVWIEPHQRGKADEGQIAKDYRIVGAPPKEEER